MNIHKIKVAGHTISFGNDQKGAEPDCWKTKIDEYTWTAGESTIEQALQAVLDDVLETANDH